MLTACRYMGSMAYGAPAGARAAGNSAAARARATSRDREVRHRATHVSAGVAVLQAPNEHRVDRRAGDDAELSARETARASDQLETPMPMPP